MSPARLAAFERRYAHTAQPFPWKFTRHDLDLLLKRLADTPDLAKAARTEPAIRHRNPDQGTKGPSTTPRGDPSFRTSVGCAVDLPTPLA